MSLNKEYVLSQIKKTKLIGISGFATSGKDTFYVILNKYLSQYGIETQRIAFADRLKDEIEPYLVSNFGISAWTKNQEQKKIIRPLLVAHGAVRRQLSNGTYWTSFINEETDRLIKNGIIPVITDVRFCEHNLDEVFWIKNKGGECIYLTRHFFENGQKKYVSAPNQEESKNDKALRDNAKIIIDWPTDDGILKSNEGEQYVESFIKAL